MTRLKSTDLPEGSPVRRQLEAAERESERMADQAEGRARSGGGRRRHEDDLQRQIIGVCDSWPMAALLKPGLWPAKVRQTVLGKWVYHVPNGGHRSAAEAAILIGLGVRAGVSDLVLWLPTVRDGRPWAGLYGELKVGDNDLTDKQRDFQQRADLVGWRAATIRSLEDWRANVEHYFHDAEPFR